MRSLASFSLLVSVSSASSLLLSSLEAKKKFNEQFAKRSKVSAKADTPSIGSDPDIIEVPRPKSRQTEDRVEVPMRGGQQGSPVPLVNVRYASRATGECFELGINDEKLANNALAGMGQLLVNSMTAGRCPPDYNRPPQVQGMPPRAFRGHQLEIESSQSFGEFDHPGYFPQEAWDNGHPDFYHDGGASQFPYYPPSQNMHYPGEYPPSQRGGMYPRVPSNSGGHGMPRIQPNTRGPSNYPSPQQRYPQEHYPQERYQQDRYQQDRYPQEPSYPTSEDYAVPQRHHRSQPGSRPVHPPGRGEGEQPFSPPPRSGGHHNLREQYEDERRGRRQDVPRYNGNAGHEDFDSNASQYSRQSGRSDRPPHSQAGPRPEPPSEAPFYEDPSGRQRQRTGTRDRQRDILQRPQEPSNGYPREGDDECASQCSYQQSSSSSSRQQSRTTGSMRSTPQPKPAPKPAPKAQDNYYFNNPHQGEEEHFSHETDRQPSHEEWEWEQQQQQQQYQENFRGHEKKFDAEQSEQNDDHNPDVSELSDNESLASSQQPEQWKAGSGFSARAQQSQTKSSMSAAPARRLGGYTPKPMSQQTNNSVVGQPAGPPAAPTAASGLLDLCKTLCDVGINVGSAATKAAVDTWQNKYPPK